MSRIVVFGANGRTGHAVVEEALKAGQQVTAAVRTPASFTAPTDAPDLAAAAGHRLDVVAADVRDAASIEAAVIGHDVVVCAVGPSGRRALGLYSDAARALVPALEAAGVKRLIAITSAGVRHDDPNFGRIYRLLAGTLMKEAYDNMRLMESIISESALDWTFVRPTRLQDDLPSGYRVQDGGTPENGWQVNRADIARFIVEEIENPKWSKAAPTLAQ